MAALRIGEMSVPLSALSIEIPAANWRTPRIGDRTRISFRNPCRILDEITAWSEFGRIVRRNRRLVEVRFVKWTYLDWIESLASRKSDDGVQISFSARRLRDRVVKPRKSDRIPQID